MLQNSYEDTARAFVADVRTMMPSLQLITTVGISSHNGVVSHKDEKSHFNSIKRYIYPVTCLQAVLACFDLVSHPAAVESTLYSNFFLIVP